MKCIAVVVLSLTFWRFNPSANEMEYWVHDPDDHSSYPCGYISRNHLPQPGVVAEQGYMVDIVRPLNVELVGSYWMSDLESAESFVKLQCSPIGGK